MTHKQNLSEEDKAAYRKEKQDEVRQTFEEVKRGALEMMGSTKFKEYLDFYARFPSYSVNNTILLMRQNPRVSIVCGYKAWQKVGRQVKKGEVGLRILAPLQHRLSEDEPVPSGLIEQDGQDEQNGQNDLVVRGYKLATVFDVSQTEGDPLPEVTQPLNFDFDGYEVLKQALTISTNYAIEIVSRSKMGQANGACDHRQHKIVVCDDLRQAQQIKTLLHEIAHSRLHAQKLAMELPKPIKEMEAECTAYVVAKHFGLNTEDFSLGYIATWTNATQELTEEAKNRMWHNVMQRVTSVSGILINTIEENLALMRNKEPMLEQKRRVAAEENRAPMRNKEPGHEPQLKIAAKAPELATVAIPKETKPRQLSLFD